MKFLAVFVFAILAICAVQAQSDNCPTICPALYSPVCGYDNTNGCHKEFSNSCEMNASKCNGKGTFSSADRSECSKTGVKTC